MYKKRQYLIFMNIRCYRPQFTVGLCHRIGMNSRVTQLGVRTSRITYLITIMAASQLHVLGNENAEMASRSL